MKRILWSGVVLAMLLLGFPAKAFTAQQWEVVWQATGLDDPVAATYDPITDAVYVSNQNGEEWSGTGGYIAKLDPATGAIVTRHFIGSIATDSPLRAPKGLAVLGDIVFVADIESLKAFSLASQQASGVWSAPDGHLVDVTLGPGRDLFVSDTQNGEVLRLVWSNYVYTLQIFYGPIGSPGPLGLMGGSVLVGLGSQPNWAVAKIDISTQEAFAYVDKDPGNLIPRGLDTDDTGGIFFSSGADIYQADRDGNAQTIITENGAPTGLVYAREPGLLISANPVSDTVTAYRRIDNPTPSSTPVPNQVTAGGDHSLVVYGNRGIFGWGYNSYKQVSGSMPQNVVTAPVSVNAFPGWKRLAAGWQHSLGIKGDGSLWGWGWNWFGQIGLGTQGEAHQTVNAVTQVGSTTGWTDVAGGDAHTLAIRSGGLYAFGCDDFGQIGAGHDPVTPENRPTPLLVDKGGANPWVQVAAGGYHSLAVRTDGSLYAWGRNALGQLGLKRLSAIDYRAFPSLVDAGPWRKVCAGGGFSAGIKADGSLWAWGENQYGQLGQGMTSAYVDQPVRLGLDADWTDLACGKDHVLAIRNHATLWGVGHNNIGQLGVGDLADRSTLVPIGQATTWGRIACGYLHSLAVRADGMLYGFGDNRSSQLGVPGVTMYTSPVALNMSLLPAAISPQLLLLLSP